MPKPSERRDVITWPRYLRGLAHLARKRRSLREAEAVLALPADAAQSIGSVLERNAREWPGRPALKHEGGTLTHGELNAWANRIARHWGAEGFGKGDVVAVLLENRAELVATVAGTVKTGAACGMINTQQRRGALVHSLRTCKPRAFVVGAELVEAFEEVRPELGALGDRPRYFVADPQGEHAGATPPVGYLDFAEATRDRSEENPETTGRVTLSDPAYLIFTSGTTGLPKAAVVVHARWVKGAASLGMACLDVRPTDTVYAPLPLYHTQALTAAWCSAGGRGAALAIRRRFSASRFWEDCRRYDATIFFYIGEVCRYLLNRPPSEDERRHRVRRAMGVGLRPELWDAFKGRFGLRAIYEMYGATEMNLVWTNVMNLDRTCGRSLYPFAVVRFDVERGEPTRGPDGRMIRVAKGEVGLCISQVTPQFRFVGYTDKEATERKLLRDVFAPGDLWVNSGDLVRDQGFRHVQFIDRVGDTFRWKSENVSTTEVERVLNAHPTVAESTVYGVEVPGLPGRAGMAAVVPAEGKKLDPDALLAHLARELPDYAVPVFVRVVPALETTGTFKNRKVALQTEGFDPERIADPLFARRHGGRYKPLTAALAKEIREGRVRL